MKYKLKKETKPTLPTFGKYKAVAVHQKDVIDSKYLVRELCKKKPYGEAEVTAVVIGLADAIAEYLRAGCKVRLHDWGLLKLEIESAKVDSPDDFDADKHIRGVRLHFIPESVNGTQPLYDGITFENDDR